MAIDEIARKFRVKLSQTKFRSIYGKKFLFKEEVFLIKPLTMMNLSGESVREWVRNFKIPVSKIIVIYDDIDLPLGSIRIRKKGSGGTHKGMRSIVEALSKEDIKRIRIGIKPEYKVYDLREFVLTEFEEDEFRTVKKTIKEIPDIISDILVRGIDYVMSKYNKKSLLAEESAG